MWCYNELTKAAEQNKACWSPNNLQDDVTKSHLQNKRLTDEAANNIYIYQLFIVKAHLKTLPHQKQIVNLWEKLHNPMYTVFPYDITNIIYYYEFKK